jgi:hypothetical protein
MFGGFMLSLMTSVIFPIILKLANVTILMGQIIYILNLIIGLVSISNIVSVDSETVEKEDELYEIINPSKQFWYRVLSISNGISIAPLIIYATSVNPLIVPMAIISTIGIFATLTIYVLRNPNIDVASFEAPLISCLGGLIIASLFKMTLLIFGFDELAFGIDSVTTLLTLFIFGIMIMFDTDKAVKSYNQKKLDSIKMATELLLDVTNIFVSLIKIFIKIVEKKN